MKKINKTLSNNYYLLITIYCLLNTFNSYSQGAGTALEFNGVSDYYTHNLSLNKQEGTITHWTKRTSATSVLFYESNGTTTARYDGFGDPTDLLEIHTGFVGNKAAFIYQDGGVSARIQLFGNLAIVENEWVHIAATWNRSGEIRLYVNGVLDLSQDISLMPFSSHIATVKQVGKTGSGSSRYLNGQLDELSIWNRALTQTEIQQNMCKKLTGTEPGLVAYYPMNEGIDNTCSGGEDVCDLTGNGNNGVKF